MNKKQNFSNEVKKIRAIKSLGNLYKNRKTNKNSSNHKKVSTNIKKYLSSLVGKLHRRELLTSNEEEYVICSGVLFDIIEDLLNKIFNISKENKKKNFTYFNDSSIDDSNIHESLLPKNDIKIKGQNTLKDSNKDISEVNNNFDEDFTYNNNNIISNKEEDTSDLEKDNIINEISLQKNQDKFLSINKYENIENSNEKKLINKKKALQTKPIKLKSQKLIHYLPSDFINTNDLKEGFLNQKKLIKSLSLNPIQYKNLDEILVKKNLKLMKLILSSESDNEIEHENSNINLNINNDKYNNEENNIKLSNNYSKTKTKNLVKRTIILKNVNTLIRKQNDIRENWNFSYGNINLGENLKLKFMDIVSNKNHLKNIIESLVLERINNTLNDNLDSDKINKVSKRLLKLYRNKNYYLDIEKYNIEEQTIFPNLNIVNNAKQKIIKENKDYLISSYFDIYEDILFDIYNSGNLIYEFNDQIKGNSILSNFQIDKAKNEKRLDNEYDKENNHLYKNDYLKKNYSQNILYDMVSFERFSICDKKRIFNQNILNNNQNVKKIYNYEIKNTQQCNENNNVLEYEETKSNYDKLGLPNQTYINNILLRDFTYKEKKYYQENSCSDFFSDVTVVENCSRGNDFESTNNTPIIHKFNCFEVSNSNNQYNIKYSNKANESLIKSQFSKYIKYPLKKTEYSSEIKGNIQDTIKNFSRDGIFYKDDNLNGNIKIKDKTKIKRKNSSEDEIKANDSNIQYYNSINIKNQNKKRNSKKRQTSNLIDNISNINNICNNNIKYISNDKELSINILKCFYLIIDF